MHSLWKGKPRKTWITEYSASHRHPFNLVCHLIGIPLITLSLPLFPVAFLSPLSWMVPSLLFIVGWTLQFAGHAVEGKPPEFLRDWRYLLVGFSWWISKVFQRRRLKEDDSLSS